MPRLQLLAVLIFFAFFSPAQSFHKAALVFDLNSGVEAFNTVQRYRASATGSETSIESEAANKYASAGMEIGLNRRIGIGLRGKMNSFFRDVDELTRQRTSIHSTDMLLMLNLHPIVRDRFDLLVGADIGISDISFIFEGQKPTTLESRGRYFAPYICSRFYWGRIGFHLRAAFPRTNYKEIVRSSEDRGESILSGWAGKGLGLSIGMQFRLF